MLSLTYNLPPSAFPLCSPMHDSQQQLRTMLDALGITPDILQRRALAPCDPARELQLAEVDRHGRQHQLIPAAATAWHDMKQAAAADAIVLEIVSAFRPLERQAEIIRTKLDKGMEMDRILSLSAPPGYSEHHTGRAVDINTPGCEPTEEEFEHTEAFAWLCREAHRFGFTLSYPRGNAHGFVYEPWHWYYQPGGGKGEAR